jgi:hypothetical protein
MHLGITLVNSMKKRRSWSAKLLFDTLMLEFNFV